MELMAGGMLLRLLPQRAAYLPSRQTLLVADTHLGKAVSFRRLGVPVPEATTDETLQRLTQAIAGTGARNVVFLGDLLHSARSHAAATMAAVARWREQHAGLALTLVRGNHDNHAGDPPAAWGVDCVDGPLHMGGLALAHQPEAVPGRYVVAGHLHPAAVVGGRGRDRLRLPCFHFGPAVGVLPAFGAFTGMHVMPHSPGNRVYVVADGAVRALPGLHTLAA
ncbi:MAG TPA: ligase-associated DNA damage response endonuclease PdeM [Rubrivivax sp.]|nr:ligase-associated DNA damage response endonuclease PdeM [Rubrivivax sp.]